MEEEEEPPLLRQHRLKTSGTRREKTSVLPPPDAELKPGTICDLPSPPPRRRVEQKNGEETTPRLQAYSVGPGRDIVYLVIRLRNKFICGP